MGEVDDYLSGLDPSARAAFERVRDLAMEIVPDAEQGRSYGMAALRYQHKPLLGFLATKRHLSIFPFSPGSVEAVREELDGFDLSKGTVRFGAAAPLPDAAVRSIVRHRLAEILGTV